MGLEGWQAPRRPQGSTSGPSHPGFSLPGNLLKTQPLAAASLEAGRGLPAGGGTDHIPPLHQDHSAAGQRHHHSCRRPQPGPGPLVSRWAGVPVPAQPLRHLSLRSLCPGASCTQTRWTMPGGPTAWMPSSRRYGQPHWQAWALTPFHLVGAERVQFPGPSCCGQPAPHLQIPSGGQGAPAVHASLPPGARRQSAAALSALLLMDRLSVLSLAGLALQLQLVRGLGRNPRWAWVLTSDLSGARHQDRCGLGAPVGNLVFQSRVGRGCPCPLPQPHSGLCLSASQSV